MSFEKFKTSSYCAGGRHHCSTTNFAGDISFKKETGNEIKLLTGNCSICNRKKLKTVSDNTIQAESLGDFFNRFAEKGLNVTKQMARNVLKNPRRALEIRANVGTAFASRSPKAALISLPEVINSYHTAEGLYFGNVV